MRTALFVCTFLLLGPAVASSLQPYQQRALDTILATMDPQMQAMMRPQLQQSLSVLDAAQVEMLLASMDGEQADDTAVLSSDETAEAVVSDEDLAWNRAQYEPAFRKAWAADKAFDDFVDATLADACPPRGTYAVWGSAWRFEVYALDPIWPRASQNVDLDVEILGASYAPQDGRYQFNFADLRESFEKEDVAKAVRAACADYAKVGETFLLAARDKVTDKNLDDGPLLETTANAKADRIRGELEDQLKKLSPNSKNTILMAMVSGQRLN